VSSSVKKREHTICITDGMLSFYISYPYISKTYHNGEGQQYLQSISLKSCETSMLSEINSDLYSIAGVPTLCSCGVRGQWNHTVREKQKMLH